LRKDGFELAHVVGSHHKFRHPRTGAVVTVPHPRKDFPAGTFAIFKQAGWPWS
jgi:predicted RNA binding protein YcfA (HicA-like mRNA interferase family)